jgi:SRSO17 transposase
VLADAGYGNSIDFREGLSAVALSYCVGVQSNTGVWTKDTAFASEAKDRHPGHQATRLRRAPGHVPWSVKDVAFQLPVRAR